MTMNFKQFFYKDYYEGTYTVHVNNRNEQRRINLEKPDNEPDFKEIKKWNKPVFDKANETLKNAPVNQADLNLLSLDGNQYTGFSLETVYPGLLIGSGYTHETNNEAEFKLGFYFDHSTGLPCIPGSSVKGMLRSAFPQFKTEKANPYSAFKAASEIQESKLNYIATLFGLESDADKKRTAHLLELVIFEGIDTPACQQKSDAGKWDEIEYLSIYKRIIFHHAHISRAAGNKIFEIDTITPHHENPLKNPTPLNFLKIRPGVEFTFNFEMPQGFSVDNISVAQIKEAFKTMLKDLGIGAKTNVGYGQFKQE
jgi:CRISPR-associated protein Cmr6